MSTDEREAGVKDGDIKAFKIDVTIDWIVDGTYL